MYFTHKMAWLKTTVLFSEKLPIVAEKATFLDP